MTPFVVGAWSGLSEPGRAAQAGRSSIRVQISCSHDISAPRSATQPDPAGPCECQPESANAHECPARLRTPRLTKTNAFARDSKRDQTRARLATQGYLVRLSGRSPPRACSAMIRSPCLVAT